MKLIIFVSVLLLLFVTTLSKSLTPKKLNDDKFTLFYEWNYINYTWPSEDAYQEAIDNGKYIPEHNIITGIKYYDGVFYFALPKAKPGATVTLTSLSVKNASQKNSLLSPYPNWDMNTNSSCDALQDVQSMEIDPNGVMWVLDGRRIDPNVTKCPPRIVLLDLKKGGKVIQSYVIPEQVCNPSTCFLNDLVLDDIDGGYAYITDTNSIKPGLIVYSRGKNRAWKAHDDSMLVEPEIANFSVNGHVFSLLIPVDGIALDSREFEDNADRFVYYTSLTGVTLYKVNSRVLRDEEVATTPLFNQFVVKVGKKIGPTDGMIVDNHGFLYYGILTQNSVASWDWQSKIEEPDYIDENNDLMVWPDTFAFDDTGYLYIVANNIGFYLEGHISKSEINFRVLRYYTGSKSYQYDEN